MMHSPSASRFSRITANFETLIIRSVQILLGVVIIIAAAELWLLLAVRLKDGSIGGIGTVSDLQEVVKKSFAGVLLVVLGLEILESLRTYTAEHRVRLETILIVAIVAMGRHVIQLDIEHESGIQLIGIGALFLSLTCGYFLVKPWGSGHGKTFKYKYLELKFGRHEAPHPALPVRSACSSWPPRIRQGRGGDPWGCPGGAPQPKRG